MSSHFSSIINRPGGILSVAELRSLILSHCSVVHVVDLGIGRDVNDLIPGSSGDVLVFLDRIFRSFQYVQNWLARGTVSFRGPYLDQFVGAAKPSRFCNSMALLLLDEGYVRHLSDWTLDTWNEVEDITILTKSSPLSIRVPYFHTVSGIHITIMLYDSTNPCGWNEIPGVCVLSSGLCV